MTEDCCNVLDRRAKFNRCLTGLDRGRRDELDASVRRDCVLLDDPDLYRYIRCVAAVFVPQACQDRVIARGKTSYSARANELLKALK